MTCRIAAREYTFTQFTEVEIADFDWEQINIFVNNWFKNKPYRIATILHRINKIYTKEFIKSPFLLTLLCLIYEDCKYSFSNRCELYKEILKILYSKWDAKRGIQRDEIYKKLWNQRKEELLSREHPSF